MAAVLTDLVHVDLEAGCRTSGCAELAWRMFRKLSPPHYSRGASVLDLGFYAEWHAEHRTARKRAARAARLGYRFAQISRSEYPDDIHEVNCSLAWRQGRPMDAAYLEHRDYPPLPSYPCDRHRIHEYGVLDEGDRLRAYLVFYRVGALGLISQILGHGAHLDRDIMYLLGAELIRVQAPLGGCLYYNRHDSGTTGLRFYKERLGFRPCDIAFAT